MTELGREIDSPAEDRRFGSGWISGILSLVLAMLGLATVLCLRYPQLLTVADAREMYNVGLIRLALHLVLVSGFLLGIVSIVLRKQRILGFSAMGLVLLATILGGSQAQSRFEMESDLYFGLDWFLLNLISTLVHANLRTNFSFLERWLVTPRFHHWHHGIEREAIDVNFAVHFPLFDRLFGTHHLPDDGRWPEAYGVANHPVPKGFIRQHLYPIQRSPADQQDPDGGEKSDDL